MRSYLLFTMAAPVLLVVSTSRAQGFLDDFEDGNLHDDNPVSWIAIDGTINPVAGSMQLTLPPPFTGSSAFVEDFDHQDILIEMTFEYTSADNQFISPLFRDRLGTGGNFYYAGVLASGELAIGYFEDSQSFVTRRGIFLPTRNIDSGDDVTLLVEMIGPSITLEAWETAAGRAESAALSWTDTQNRYPRGTDIGLGFNPKLNPSPILFHSYGVTLIPRSAGNCDFNSDAECDIDDLNALLAEGPIARDVTVIPGVNDQFDLSGNGIINNGDVDSWLARAAAANGFGSPYLRGDANLDGMVDISDFNLWNEHKFTSTLLWNQGNFDGDAVTGVSDFNYWNANKFTSSDTTWAVPEPAAAVLFLMATLVGCGCFRGSPSLSCKHDMVRVATG